MRRLLAIALIIGIAGLAISNLVNSLSGKVVATMLICVSCFAMFTIIRHEYILSKCDVWLRMFARYELPTRMSTQRNLNEQLRPLLNQLGPFESDPECHLVCERLEALLLKASDEDIRMLWKLRKKLIRY